MHRQHRSVESPLFVYFPAAALLAFLAPASAAQATDGPRRVEEPEHPAVQAAIASRHQGYQSFIRDAGGDWAAHFNEETGAPSLIYGSGLRVAEHGIGSMAAAEAAADATLKRFANLWGAPISQFELQTKTKAGRLYIFSWTQKWDGLDVRGGRIQIQIHEAGRVAALAAEGVKIPDGFSRLPKLGPEQAEAIVKKGKRVAPADSIDATDFLIFNKAENGRGEARLAYRVDVRQPWANVYERVFVDANNGEILEIEPGRYNFDVKGKVTGTLSTALSGLAGPTAGQPIGGITVNVSGVGTATTDANGDYYIATGLPGPFTVSAQLLGPNYNVNNAQGSDLSASTGTLNIGGIQTGNLNFNGVPAQFNTSQATAAHHYAIVDNYIRSRVPAYTGFGQHVVNTNVNDICNAYFDVNNKSLNFFASGGGCVNSAYSTVIYHEFGHGVDDNIGSIQSSSLSEALGDVLAMYISGQPIIGEDFGGLGSYIRTGENTTTYPASGCGGDPHCAGEPFMGFSWQARKALIVALGSVDGIAAAEQAFMNVFPANSQTNAGAATQVFVNDDDDGNLANGTPHYSILAGAATMKGFTPPTVSIPLIAIEHIRYPDTYNQSKPYAIYAQLTPQAGYSVGSAFVDYNINGGSTVSVPMLQNAQGLYVGNIPAQTGPAVISYNIRALTNFNNTVLKISGDDAYRFAVGKKTTLFFSDLESGPAGWTHVQVTKSDDWELGHPQFYETNNYDPLNAYSGSNCWGNDLQNDSAQQNGLYTTNVENYLETPNINASGHTGVRVRFRRWLTVQGSASDQAQVLVNNSVVYTNPTSSLFDSSWTLQDHAAPAADNVSNFRARWRLKTNGSTNYGGWTIDDVEVYSIEATPVLFMNIAVNSPTIPLGTTLTFNLNGTIGSSWQLYASLDPGPGTLDGFGVIGAGLGTLSYFIEAPFDANGNFQLGFPIPIDPILSGITIYWVGGAFAAGALPQISNTVQTTFQ